MLAHYEIYKSITNLPGDILEFGVYKCASLIRLATFRNALENDFSRKIIGFDAFGKFPTEKIQSDDDTSFIKSFECAGGVGLGLEEAQSVMDLKGFSNIHLVKGNVFETLPHYLEENPQTRIAFLHLDMDVKEPTTLALELLYDRVVPNGVIVIDDYNSVTGATVAVDEFVQQKNLRIEKLKFYSVPAFIKKCY